MIRWFVENRVAANLLMLGIIIGGIFSIRSQLTYETFPSVERDYVEVSTVYEGASPEQIDRLIIVPIQQAIDDIDSVKLIRGFAREGSASMIIELERGADKDELRDEIEKKVNAISTLPDEAETPDIRVPERRRRAVQLVISGDLPAYQLSALVQDIETRAAQIEGVLATSVSGLTEREFSIWVDPKTLEKYDLSLGEVAQIIANKTGNFSLGNIDTARGRILIKSDGERRAAQDYQDVVIKTLDNGSQLTLATIATIEDTFERTDFDVRLDGNTAAFINVYQSEGANILDLSDAAHALVEEEAPYLPEGVLLEISNDSSQVFKSRLSTLVNNGIQGGLLVLLSLALLLRLRIAFWVAIGIPVTFLGGFMLMPWLGVSLNMISMFGYILVLGIVVDDAIVTAENVFVHYNRHGDQVRAAIEGTQEIAVPVTFGVLTTVAAMLPFFLVTGRLGTLFSFLAIIVVIVLLFSLVESKLILPAHLSGIDREKPSPIIDTLNKFFGAISSAFERFVIRFYKPLLRFCLNNIGITLGFYLAALIIIIGLVAGGKVPFQFFPRIPGDSIEVNITMPTGTPYETTLQAVEQVEKATMELKAQYQDKAINGYVQNILVESGGSSPETAKVEFELAPEEERLENYSNSQLLSDWQTLMGVLPGVESLSFRTQAFGGGGSDVALALIGDDVTTLKSAGDVIQQRLLQYDGVIESDNSLSDGRLEIDMQLTNTAVSLGLEMSDIISQVRAAMNGATVQTLLIGGNEIDVMVRYPEEAFDSIAELRKLPIKTSRGFLPLSSITSLSEQIGPATVVREDGRLLSSVTAKVDQEVAIASQIQSAIETDAPELLSNFRDISIEQGADKVEEAETNRSIFMGMIMAGLLIYILLAIPFKSYGKPIIVMSIVPFGLAGAVLGHWVWGSNLYMPSMLGMLALLGILVNDSLVMVDYINKNVSAGGSLKTAVLEAGVRRFRPIFLTTLTTALGVMPLLFETSRQAKFLEPMAISLGFGIIFGTLVTLIMVPVNYVLYTYARPLISSLLKLIFMFAAGGLLVYILFSQEYVDLLHAMFAPIAALFE